MGAFTVELYTKHAPRTCKNFEELSKRGYYRNTIFHRIIRGFMIQGGDPTGYVFYFTLSLSSSSPFLIVVVAVSLRRTGRGGKSIYGDKFQDEITRDLKHTGAGIVSMANSGPNTNGSQFFVTLAPTPWLDGKHTIFGRISEGMGVIKRLGNVQTDTRDRPTTTVRIVQTWKGGIEDKPNQSKDLMRMIQ